MMKIRKVAVLWGMVSLAIAAIGIVVVISQPAQSKDNRTSSGGDGVITTLGF
jgi:hypothetical protein